MQERLTLADGTVLDLGRFPLPHGVEDGILNRAQLAVAFGVSENTVGKWITAGMPMLSQGQNGVSYEFRLSHCWAWKQSRDAAVQAQKTDRDRIAQQAALVFRNLTDDDADEEHTLTATDIRAWAEAEYKRNQVAEQRGDLVRAERVRALIEDVVQAFASQMDTLPDWAELEFGLAAKDVQKVQDRCDELRGEVRRILDQQLGRPAVVIGLDGLPSQQTAMAI